MIVDALLKALHALLAPVLTGLPSASLPDFPAVHDLAGWFGLVDGIVPVSRPLAAIWGIVQGSFAALVTYRIGLFIYNRVRG